MVDTNNILINLVINKILSELIVGYRISLLTCISYKMAQRPISWANTNARTATNAQPKQLNEEEQS